VTDEPTKPHIPVLLSQVLELLTPSLIDEAGQGRLIDGTLGAGGHSRALLAAGARAVLGCDLDAQAIALARVALAAYGERVHIEQASYVQMAQHAARLGWQQVDAILLDLGISSMQIDTAARGFSFRYDAPLDMRFDPHSARPTAADVVNGYSEAELTQIFWEYGEEQQARKLARAIVDARPLYTTTALAAVLERAAPRLRGQKAVHPATRVFQALRLVVNGELDNVTTVLPLAIDLLRPGGRLGVISFHSLEDRIVKDTFKLYATDCICPPRVPICVCGHVATVRLLTKKPLIASEEESTQNPRSRSAKLRVIEKLP
jgi:16S rRNA (cytosine1402-N4)-methyltransferase